jgi:hypothetical protein
LCLGHSVTDDLIAGHMVSGVKLAGRQYRRLHGTREVDIVLLTE